jgi:AhpD family alkylhydroperoxidase
MKAKESVFKGYFISKNITPQIQDFHAVSGEKHKKFSAFHEIVYEDGHLSKKLKKGLMGLATAILAKCPWCIRSCVRDGLTEGVVKEEIVEAINIAMVMNGCAAVSHAAATMKAAE